VTYLCPLDYPSRVLHHFFIIYLFTFYLSVVSGISWNHRDGLFHRSGEGPTKEGGEGVCESQVYLVYLVYLVESDQRNQTNKTNHMNKISPGGRVLLLPASINAAELAGMLKPLARQVTVEDMNRAIRKRGGKHDRSRHECGCTRKAPANQPAEDLGLVHFVFFGLFGFSNQTN